MEKSLKRQIVDAAEAVKKKIRKIRDIEIDNKNTLLSVFKPVTDPLNELINVNKPSSKREEVDSSFNKTLTRRKSEVSFNNGLDIKDNNLSDNEDELESDNTSENENLEESNNWEDSNLSFKTVESGQSPNKNTSSWSLSSEVFEDIPYGIRRERGKLMLGTARVVISDHHFKIAGQIYESTKGLKQLLLQKNPDLSLVTPEDMKNYKLMLMDTNAHRRYFDSKKPINSNKGQKYLKVIRPLFRLRKDSHSTDRSVQGEGLPLMKKWKNDVDYVYWDDPNELVERLKLLLASRDAGNTGVGNEIVSIIEELRESGVLN